MGHLRPFRAPVRQTASTVGAVMFAARQACRLAYRTQRQQPLDRSHAPIGRLYAARRRLRLF